MYEKSLSFCVHVIFTKVVSYMTLFSATRGIRIKINDRGKFKEKSTQIYSKNRSFVSETPKYKLIFRKKRQEKNWTKN